MHRRVFWTLRSRGFAAPFAKSMAPIAVLGIQGYHCRLQALSELAARHLAPVADTRRTNVESGLRERAGAIEVLASILRADGDFVGGFLKSFHERKPASQALNSMTLNRS